MQKFFQHISSKKRRVGGFWMQCWRARPKSCGNLWMYSHPIYMRSRSGFTVGLSQNLVKSFWAFPLTPVVFGSCSVNGETVDLYFWPQLIFIYYEWTPAASLLSKIYCLPLNFNIFLPRGWFRLCPWFAKPAGYIILLDFRQTMRG